MKKRALVLGLGASGKSAVDYLIDAGWQVVGVDRALDVDGALKSIEGSTGDFSALGELDPSIDNHLRNCSKVIISPGIDVTHPIAAKALQLSIPLQSELELGAEAICRAGSARALIAVTGSNGKTTVVSWLAHILRNCGLKALVAGNIGTPLTSCVKGDKKRIIVVEISSFQLQTMRMPLFDAGALLNITPNHLDRHESFAHYADLKCKLQALLKNKGRLLVSQSVDEGFSHLLKRPYRTFGTRICDDVTHRGKHLMIDGKQCAAKQLLQEHFSHDVSNFSAALGLACDMGLSPSAICLAAQTFNKPKHRLEWVCNRRGVDFYDDSKATSPDAVIKAVASLKKSVVLIAGGVSKKVSFEPWIGQFAKKVRQILVLGEAAEGMIAELKAHFPISQCIDLSDAVQRAALAAKAGDVVLLSPGCSSFDMFEDYRERGRQFAALAEQLNEEVAKR